MSGLCKICSYLDCRGAVEHFYPCLESLDNGGRSENTGKFFVPWSLNGSLEGSGQQQVLLQKPEKVSGEVSDPK